MFKDITKLLFVILFFPISLFSQDTKGKLIQILKSPDGIMFTDNTPGAYFTIDFKGDSILDVGIQHAFKINDHIYQVMLNEFSKTEYDFNKDDSAREIALLKTKMDSELDYISKEVFKKPVVSGFEIFKNKDRKNYLLWYYVSPATGSKDVTGIRVTRQYFLTFVANEHVAGVNTPVFENEGAADIKKSLKELADRIDVFGNRIDIDALYSKLDARSGGKDLEYVDSANGYKLTFKEWFNITESPGGGISIGTLPDIDNIQNAIMVKPRKKTDYKSFEDFNESIISSNLKTGDKIGGTTFLLKKDLPKPPVVNGISKKITLQQGSQVYESHYFTIETEHCYLSVVFTATSKTFDFNHPRFLEFVDDIVLMK